MSEKKFPDGMTLEELWELFPITLVNPEPEKWKEQFDREKTRLVNLIGESMISLNHAGSTAIGTIKSKPIIDIFIETDDLKKCAAILSGEGYIIMSESDDRISLNKGYTPEGYADEVFHIHLRKRGDADEIFFCRYLKERFDEAKEYESLKIKLLSEYGKDRDGYTAAKSDFVRKITSKAKKIYKK